MFHINKLADIPRCIEMGQNLLLCTRMVISSLHTSYLHLKKLTRGRVAIAISVISSLLTLQYRYGTQRVADILRREPCQPSHLDWLVLLLEYFLGPETNLRGETSLETCKPPLRRGGGDNGLVLADELIQIITIFLTHIFLNIPIYKILTK